MRSPSKQAHEGAADRRTAERRGPAADRREDVARALVGDRREGDQRAVAEAMVDALDDILKWERASERALRVAPSSASLEEATH